MLYVSCAVGALVVGFILVTTRRRTREENGRKLDRSSEDLRTIASFEASSFEMNEDGDENPQEWGEALLREIVSGVGATFGDASEIEGESYGFGAILETAGGRWHLRLGYREPDWLLFVSEADGSAVSDRPSSRALLERLDRTLRDLEGVSDLRWTNRAGFDAPGEEWHEEPIAQA